MGVLVSTPIRTTCSVFFGIASMALFAIWKYQTSLIYPSNFPEGSRTVVDVPLNYDMPYEDVKLTTKDGETLQLYSICHEKAADDRKTILILNPNAGNIGHALPLAQMFYKKMGYNVVMYSYRGYGLSTGKACESGLKIDAETVLDYLLNHPVYSNTSVVLYGRSLGGAVAFHMASLGYKELIKAIVIENTFLSIPKVVPNVLPMLGPFAFLCSEKWNTESIIEQLPSDLPALFLGGARDELVPPSHMKRLFELCKSETKQFESFEKGTHNDTTIQPGYFEKVWKFIAKNVAPIEQIEDEPEPESKEKF